MAQSLILELLFCASGSSARLIIMAKNKLEGVDLAMRGGGYYSAATKGARDVVDNATPLVLDTVDRLPDCDTSTVFTMTDMGCADGGTSLDLVRQVIAAVQTVGPGERSVSFTLTSRAMISTVFSRSSTA